MGPCSTLVRTTARRRGFLGMVSGGSCTSSLRSSSGALSGFSSSHLGRWARAAKGMPPEVLAAMEDEKIYKVVSTAATNESQENSSSPLAILTLGLFVGGMIAFVAARHQYKKYMYTEIAPRNNFQMVFITINLF